MAELSARNAVALAKWLGLKARQRGAARIRSTRVRLNERLPFREEQAPTVDLLPWHPLAAVPGNPAMMPWARATDPDPGEAAFAAKIREHRFTLLSADEHEVHIEDPRRREKIAQLAGALPREALGRYRPIDWHADFHSGYRWKSDELYLDVRVAPVVGADIKVPRELSRFQHVGALARGPLDEGGVEFLLQIVDWIAANPIRRGVNWACTMDVALRAVNWIWGVRLFEPVVTRYPSVLRLISGSLHRHGRHIEDNLEYYEDCTSNHYLSNVAGLIYIGATCPEFPEADRWLAFGLQELVSEMSREVYPDGADFEASTHYHRLVADLFVSCAALAERIPPARRQRLDEVDCRAHRVEPRLRPLRESGVSLSGNGHLLPTSFYSRLARMAEFTVALTKPNGLVPQFGDNDSARAHYLLPTISRDVRDHAHLPATVGELLHRPDLVAAGQAAGEEGLFVAGDLRGRVVPPPARDLARPVLLFADAGIAISRTEDAWLAVTCGPNGQGGRGGHGHNDKNGFELNVCGLDIVVDGGCVAYTSQPAVRNRCRSTEMHSTVSVDGLEQDQWPEGPAGLFRLPERSQPSLALDADGTVVGRHVGFGPLHERRFRLVPGRLSIDDVLEDTRPRSIAFNFDAGIMVEAVSTGVDIVRGVLVRKEGLRIRFEIVGATAPTVTAGAFGRGYGIPVENSRLSLAMTGSFVHTEFRWSP